MCVYLIVIGLFALVLGLLAGGLALLYLHATIGTAIIVGIIVIFVIFVVGIYTAPFHDYPYNDPYNDY
jgi:hypothetical protein